MPPLARRFTSQLPKLGILGRTIGRVVPQIAVFFLISCVIFLAFAQCFLMAYYATVPGYQSYGEALMSVLRFTVLDFDYDALSQVWTEPSSKVLCVVCSLQAAAMHIMCWAWLPVPLAHGASVFHSSRLNLHVGDAMHARAPPVRMCRS